MSSNTPMPLPCNGWTLNTRTLPSICPEVVVDALPRTPGMVTIGGMTFDSAGALYVSDTATGQVMRLIPNNGRFDPPKPIAEGLDLPSGIVCADTTCYVATDTAIVRLSDDTSIVSNLPSDGVRPLRLGLDGRLYTTRGGKLASVAVDGSDSRDVSDAPAPVSDLMWLPDGTLWASDGLQTVRSGKESIAFDSASTPTGLAFYPDGANLAFPQFGGGVLVVTSGSWNTPVIAGYELWIIPFSASHPAAPIRLIPADTERSSSDASLVSLSFFPDHPVAVAVSSEGWIYVATREGRIVRLRPRT